MNSNKPEQQELLHKVGVILNKLPLQNYDVRLKKFKKLKINADRFSKFSSSQGKTNGQKVDVLGGANLGDQDGRKVYSRTTLMNLRSKASDTAVENAHQANIQDILRKV